LQTAAQVQWRLAPFPRLGKYMSWPTQMGPERGMRVGIVGPWVACAMTSPSPYHTHTLLSSVRSEAQVLTWHL